MSDLYTGRRCGIVATGAALLLALSHLAAAQDDKKDQEPQTSEEKAEVAVEAYDKEDAGPKENWFGCPPAKGDADKAEEASENCEPSDQAPQADAKPTQTTE